MIRLFDIAYLSRHSVPLLLSVVFMLADVHFRVELQFEARFVQNQDNLNDQEENRLDLQHHQG